MRDEAIYVATAALIAIPGLLVGCVIAPYLRRRAIARAALPIVNISGANIVIINRLDEEVRIVKIAVSAPFATNFRLNSDNHADSVEHWYKKSRDCNLPVAPRGQAWLRLLIRREQGAPKVVLTFNSSKGTLHNQRVRTSMDSIAS